VRASAQAQPVHRTEQLFHPGRAIVEWPAAWRRRHDGGIVRGVCVGGDDDHDGLSEVGMKRAVLVILDGLRRDFVDAARTPHLDDFAARAERFPAYRTAFPSATRVVTATLATGCHPARHTLQGNAMALLDTRLPSEALLRVLKRIERRSGRRGGRPWGPRTLDIDIIDYKGLIRHWRDGRPDFVRAGPRPLVLPHPLMQERPFVLKPLLDIVPDWRHPVLGVSAKSLWRKAASRRQGQVIKRL
jgi:2-amino-4-hydroxy-6-hydroxymethyldihydropteridine diphosphokinase